MTVKTILRYIYHIATSLNPRTIYWRCRLAECGKNPSIGRHVSMFNPHFVVLGDNVVLNHHISFHVNPIGKDALLKIGNGVQLGKYNDFGCSNKIIIEDKVITAPFVHITDRDHSYNDINVPIMDQKPNSKGPVIIKEGCWLGFGVQIMSGVTIGKQSVIAAGSIITKDVPDYSIVAGNPAKVIKRYNPESHTWQKTNGNSI